MARSSAPSLLRAAWRSLPMGVRSQIGGQIRSLLAPSRAAGLPRADPGQRRASNEAVILGLGASRLGVGVAARLLAAELRAHGVIVHERDATRLVGAPLEGSPNDSGDTAGAPLIVAINPDVAVHALPRLGPHLLRNRRVIGFFVWELDRPPPFLRLAQGWVHEIWTPSLYSAQAWAPLGAPVYVTPHPVALNPPPARTPDRQAAARAELGLAPDDFVLATSFALASSLARKNPGAAIAAFARSGVRGVLLVRALFAERYPAACRALQAMAAAEGARVRLLDDADGVAGLHRLYAAADAYISLHRAEGFGLNLAEAMLSGLPVIATKHSGNLDFMDEANSLLVPCALVPVQDPHGVYRDRHARWAAPDIDAAASYISNLASNAERRRRIGEVGQRALATRLVGGEAARALRMQTVSFQEERWCADEGPTSF